MWSLGGEGACRRRGRVKWSMSVEGTKLRGSMGRGGDEIYGEYEELWGRI